MDGLTSVLSFGVSMTTAMVTFYFWIVKARREQPWLKIYQADPQVSGHAQSSCGDPVKLVFEVKSVVANYSSLPNALLAVGAAVKLRDGTWLDAEARLDPRTPLPLNMAPMQTVRLDLIVTVALPAIPEGEGCKNTHETFALYRQRYLTQPLETRVTLKTLGERLFADLLTLGKRAA